MLQHESGGLRSTLGSQSFSVTVELGDEIQVVRFGWQTPLTAEPSHQMLLQVFHRKVARHRWSHHCVILLQIIKELSDSLIEKYMHFMMCSLLLIAKKKMRCNCPQKVFF